jgi:RecA/RadA recombinase
VGRKKKNSGSAAADLQVRGDEHPIITEVLKATAEDNDPLIGLPLPALSTRYLLQANIFPLSRLVQLRGEFSAGKSALLTEIMRWFHVYGGGAIMIDTENKGSPTMLAGIFGHNEQYMARTKVVTAASVEEWQKRYMGFCQAIHKQIDATDRAFPVCIGIDSISAVEVDRRVEKVADEGHAAAGHPYLARNLSDFMRTALVSTLRHYPIALVATNHLKEDINSGSFGPPKKYAPGGAALDYYPTLILDMSKASAKNLPSRYEGQAVRISATKNNLGAPGRKIVVNLLWYNEIVPTKDVHGNDTYKNQQFHFWDWHTATIRLLVDMQTDGAHKAAAGMDPRLPGLIRQVCDLEYKHGTKNSDTPLVYSTALGISKQEALSEVEAAVVLEGNTKVVGVLHGLLGINEYTVCDPARRYREQVLEELRKNSMTDVPELMAAGSTMDIVPIDFDPLNTVE